MTGGPAPAFFHGALLVPVRNRTFAAMSGFKVPVDIGNRALQHCGAARISPTLGFAEVSKNASEVSFCYDKLRLAELRRRYWTFAIKWAVLRAVDSNTMKLAAALWSPTTTYFEGSIVADQAGDYWKSTIPNNLNNDPLLSTFWEPYFGPLSVSLYDSTTAYWAGELAYTAAGDGTSRVYMSLQSNNSDNPATATAWDATTTFFKNQVVTRSSVAYMSLIDLNTNQDPALAPALFNIATTYAAGTKVGGSDGIIYQSIGSGNVGNDPTTDGGVHWANTGVLNPWTTSFVGGAGSDKWLQIGGAEFPSGVSLTRLNILYPLGSGPATQTTSKYVYLLPAGYMRKAPQNPKPGLNPLGGPSGVAYDDWLIENGFLITGQTGPISFRFVGNFTDVARMDAMFCEGLAARIAFAVCDSITQDKGQLQIVAKIFSEWEGEAITIDGIEDDFTDSPDDEYVTVRL
jgi:hypothetical protein